jgi:SAM-dependent methyltransferase
MTGSQLSRPSFHETNPGTKQVSIRERSYMAGDIIGVNGYRARRSLLKQRFAEGGYDVRETEHFLLFTRVEVPTTIIVHALAPEEIDADIGDYFMRELKPAGILKHPQSFGEIFGAVVFSLAPRDPLSALRLYADNTLRRYQSILTPATDDSHAAGSSIASFAQIYRRVFQLHVGESFLDVGCSFGFLPLLIADRFPSLTRVYGVDLLTDPFSTVRDIAQERHLNHVQFCHADALSEQFSALGNFDTVVSLHVLEHMSEADMYRALLNLWSVTARRLIIAVPYEVGQPEAVYGHEQLFTPAKLEAVKSWCLQHLEGARSAACEECAGGMLTVERSCTRDGL